MAAKNGNLTATDAPATEAKPEAKPKAKPKASRPVPFLDQSELETVSAIRARLIDFFDDTLGYETCVYPNGNGGAKIHVYAPLTEGGRKLGGECSVLVTVEKDPDN